jgi:hypothetical protein
MPARPQPLEVGRRTDTPFIRIAISLITANCDKSQRARMTQLSSSPNGRPGVPQTGDSNKNRIPSHKLGTPPRPTNWGQWCPINWGQYPDQLSHKLGT